MPSWLKNQIRRAYYEKNRYRIRLLNDCWFHYKRLQSIEKGE
ncbi:cortex morphogenetic protein CmpA [Ectobacillus ponti]|uniref:Cortex morphogenetic protein CmpA n=1 Tax=Ectobacillus ponti TaxID=2961894 RepID=A0AA42BRD0_9BACI|nr:cortex morphogenetic protein CmpA [Ectobacillus ponti]MCP8971245.1 cortex morphogenetic protein CmpA [Ectobacillus ponti]